MFIFDNAYLLQLQSEIQNGAGGLGLRLNFPISRGNLGIASSRGIGSSLDFEEHRHYSPGDDVRHIDWHAFARTEQYLMKCFRRELSPAIDLAIDLSASMFLTERKARRTIELLYFFLEQGEELGCSVRCFTCGPNGLYPEESEALRRGIVSQFPAPGRSSLAEGLGRLPFRPYSLRILITDLLFPGSPAAVLSHLVRSHGHSMLFAPFDEHEAEPDWSGDLEFIDCEDFSTRRQLIDSATVVQYQSAYRAHFALWKDEAARYSLLMARVSASGSLAEALTNEAMRLQMVR